MGWLLLALLLVALVVGLLLSFGGEDDPESKTSAHPKPTATPSAAAASESPAATPSDGGSLLAGGEPLLPAKNGAFTSLVSQTAVGTRVVVESVNAGNGFWAGSSPENRVYIEYGSKTGEDEAGRYVPGVSDVMNLTGEARPAPRDPASALNLDAAGAKLVEDQGGFVNAETVQRAQ